MAITIGQVQKLVIIMPIARVFIALITLIHKSLSQIHRPDVVRLEIFKLLFL